MGIESRQRSGSNAAEVVADADDREVVADADAADVSRRHRRDVSRRRTHKNTS